MAVRAPRTPVHDVVAAIEQPLFIKPDERLAHRARKIVVHGEVFAAPIDGIANPLHLLHDRSAVVLLPLPDALDEGFAAHPAPALSLRSQLPLDHHLGGDSGMIGARQPHRQKSAHAMPADDDVHLRVVEHVAHVQPAGNVRRRQQQGEHVLARAGSVRESLRGRGFRWSSIRPNASQSSWGRKPSAIRAASVSNHLCKDKPRCYRSR